MNYDSTTDYTSYPKVQICAMKKLCTYCGAKKWENESPGTCCTGGKIKFLQDPPEPPRKLFTGATNVSKDFVKNIQNFIIVHSRLPLL